MEFLIDILVIFRLVQILVGANNVSTNIKSKRSLFTAVMYWNFLRLFVFHFLAILDMIHILPEIPSIIIKCIIFIALTYVIAEIVRVIEGKDKKGSSGGSTGTEKSLKRIQNPHYYGNNPPKYSHKLKLDLITVMWIKETIWIIIWLGISVYIRGIIHPQKSFANYLLITC
jgi:hypothetical protein